MGRNFWSDLPEHLKNKRSYVLKGSQKIPIRNIRMENLLHRDLGIMIKWIEFVLVYFGKLGFLSKW